MLAPPALPQGVPPGSQSSSARSPGTRRPSAARAHLSASANSSAVDWIERVLIFSRILGSRTFAWNAAMIAPGEMCGIVCRTWQNLWMYLRRVSSGFWARLWRSLTAPGRLYPPWNVPTNWSHRSGQDLTEHAGRFTNHERASGFRARENQLAITLSLPPAARTAVEYTCKNSAGFDFPSYLSGTSGLNLCGQVTLRNSGTNARHPAP